MVGELGNKGEREDKTQNKERGIWECERTERERLTEKDRQE